MVVIIIITHLVNIAYVCDTFLGKFRKMILVSMWILTYILHRGNLLCEVTNLPTFACIASEGLGDFVTMFSELPENK